jgi:ribosomal protein L29
MATKKTNLTEKNPAQLLALLTEQRETLRDHRFSAAGGRAKDSNGHKKTRAEIARLMTELGARKRAA